MPGKETADTEAIRRKRGRTPDGKIKGRTLKLIPLTQELFAKVDDADYERISAHKWQAKIHRRTGRTLATRRAKISEPNHGATIYMHCEIMGSTGVGHFSSDTLDNRRENLSLASRGQIHHMTKMYKNNTSGYRGVVYFAGKYNAQLSKDRKCLYLGRFIHAIDAAIAVDVEAVKQFGDFASLNFPERKREYEEMLEQSE